MGLIHSGVGVYAVEYVCNGVVVDVLMLSCFDAFFMYFLDIDVDI